MLLLYLTDKNTHMKTTFLSILVFTLISCNASSKEFIGTSWKVTSIQSNGSVEKATNEVILTIKSDTEFTLQLDKNNCFGTYSITGKNKIQLGDLGCTEMCCDSDFSLAVAKALPTVSTINLDKDQASLSSDEIKIKFTRYKAASTKEMKTEKASQEFSGKEKIPTESTTNVGMFENPTKTENTTISEPKGEFIELYKSPCKGTCEEFYMKFYEDGTVVYTGKYNAKVQGKHAVKLVASKSKSLFQEFQQVDFKSFQGKYDNPQIMDLQTTYLTYQGKKIEIRYKYNAPEVLKSLLEKVEARAAEALEILKEKK
jgi:heat shock protein HslJ